MAELAGQPSVLHHERVGVLLPLMLPVLAGLLLRRTGVVLAALGLAAWVLWLNVGRGGPGALGPAVAFGLVGGGLLGAAGRLLRPRALRRAFGRSPDGSRGGGSTW